MQVYLCESPLQERSCTSPPKSGGDVVLKSRTETDGDLPHQRVRREAVRRSLGRRRRRLPRRREARRRAGRQGPRLQPSPWRRRHRDHRAARRARVGAQPRDPVEPRSRPPSSVRIRRSRGRSELPFPSSCPATPAATWSETTCSGSSSTAGMVADVAWHDEGGRNPHAHILLTMRLIEHGTTSARRSEPVERQEKLSPGGGRHGPTPRTKRLRRTAAPSGSTTGPSRPSAVDAEARGDREAALRLDRPPTVHRGKVTDP